MAPGFLEVAQHALQFVTLAIQLDAYAMELGVLALKFVTSALEFVMDIMTACLKLTTSHEVSDFCHGGSHLGQKMKLVLHSVC